jgi:Uma2 family endonuclease
MVTKMKTIIEKTKYTYEDYLKIPDDVRYELIEGDLIMTPSPVTMHQRISGRLFASIFTFVKDNNLGEVFTAPYDVVFDNENVFQPDILFISKERLNIITEKNVQGAPDFVIEILSETTAYKDAIQKKKLYARFGVREYWIVSYGDKMVEVYNLRDKGEYQLIKTYFENDTIESSVITGLMMDLGKIFT